VRDGERDGIRGVVRVGTTRLGTATHRPPSSLRQQNANDTERAANTNKKKNANTKFEGLDI
jgi:hypothetical protein